MIEVETQVVDRIHQLAIINTIISLFGGRHSLITLTAPDVVIEAFPSEAGDWTIKVKVRQMDQNQAQVEME